MELRDEADSMNLQAWAAKRDEDAKRNKEKNAWEAKERQLRKEEADRLAALKREQERQAA